MSGLTKKQEKFCHLYIKTGVSSDAYRGAYSTGKMKASTIHRKAAEVLANGKVAARIAELKKDLSNKAAITREEAVLKLVNLSKGKLSDYYMEDKEGRLKIRPFSELTEEQKLRIKSVKPMRNEVEIYSVTEVLDRLSKMLGWDEATKHKVEAEVTSRPIDINQAREIVDTIINE